MITIITGTPGAGKTLYTVEKLLLPLVGKTIKTRDTDGAEVEYPRTIYTNIRGLQIDHELIDGSEAGGLRDWHRWAKPGAVIVFDEIQKIWPPRANGSKIPEDIQELDTHRHRGVDFILITQSVMNIDRHLHALGGRHLHVRRIGNMNFAIVYEWDFVSRTLQYSKSQSKKPWRFDKRVFKLYHSSDLHTKQQRKISPLFLFLPLVFLTLIVGVPMYFEKIKSREQANFQNENLKTENDLSGLTPDKISVSDDEKKPEFGGCIGNRDSCYCYDTNGKIFEHDIAICRGFSEVEKPAIGNVREHQTPLPQRTETRYIGTTNPGAGKRLGTLF